METVEDTFTPPSPIEYVANEYLSERETAVVVGLIGSASPRVVLEVGVNLGKTAAALLAGVPSIEAYVGVDVDYGHRTSLSCQRREVPVSAGKYAWPDGRFWLLSKDSRELSAADLEPIDAAFIDGDHSEAAVLHDSRLARDLLRPGGVVVWHDYGNPAVEVTRALDSLAAHGWPIRCVRGTWLAFMRKTHDSP